jgi:hypothetical protein
MNSSGLLPGGPKRHNKKSTAGICIRMTNEDVIDLYNRVKMGAIVVVVVGPHPVKWWFFASRGIFLPAHGGAFSLGNSTKF